MITTRSAPSDDQRVVSLSRHVDLIPPFAGTGAVKGGSPAAIEQRAELTEYLRDVIGVPLTHLEQRVENITLAERVWLEVEMLSKAVEMNSFDYDPLRYGR
jgi:hypothetical protein